MRDLTEGSQHLKCLFRQLEKLALSQKCQLEGMATLLTSWRMGPSWPVGTTTKGMVLGGLVTRLIHLLPTAAGLTSAPLENIEDIMVAL